MIPAQAPRADALRRLADLRARLASRGVTLSADEIISARDEGRR